MVASMTAIRTMKSQRIFGSLLLQLLLRRPSLCVFLAAKGGSVGFSYAVVTLLLLLCPGLGRLPVSVYYYYDC